SETMIWQPEFTDKTLSRKPGAVQDAGHCCLCGRVVDLCDSELDHRIALQFGGGNEETNLWTLCTECHRQKSASEAASGMPDPTLPELPDGTLRADGITGL
ncbi:HNH endonuclease, partial [Escherichia coli]|uniref:HNH endonuclease n=1 Tax=Escherichia coli TaxID=562 RepID=UPI0020221455